MKSIPTETKNRTANASRIGNASDAARELKSDRPTTIPARNAPKAIDTPNTFAAPTAIPNARTKTVKVMARAGNVAATRRAAGEEAATDMSNEHEQQANLHERPTQRQHDTGGSGRVGSERTGSRTSTRTVNRSSTTSQPTAM